MKPVLFFLWLLLSALAVADERILSFHSRIEVGRDGMLDIEETIRVRAEGDTIKRGIFRDFPQLYKGRWGLKERRPFDVLEVTRGGSPEPFVVEDHAAGSRVRIGSADELIERGEHTYTIRYRTGRQLLFSDEHDELYWNVTGDEWDFPIDDASAELILPEGIEIRSLEGFIGEKGSTEAAAATLLAGNIAEFRAGRMLILGEGLTLSATWPARALDDAVYEQPFGRLLRENPATLAGLALMAAMIGWHVFAWMAVGRDPVPGLVIPQFAPPPGYSPAALRMLNRMGFDDTGFSAAVMGLAVKGVLTIGGDARSNRLERVADADPSQLAADEQELLKHLFPVRDTLELSQSNHETVGGARKALRKSLETQLRGSHFSNNTRYWLPGLFLGLAGAGLLVIGAPAIPIVLFMTFWLSIWSIGTGLLLFQIASHFRQRKWAGGIGMGLFAIPFVVGWVVGVVMFFVGAGPLAGSAIVVAIIANFLFLRWIKAPTPLGRRVLDHVDGFKRYLTVAEGDRLGGFTCPERTPELFEMFLPYAHALDVEQKWSEQFREVLARAAQDPAQGGRGYRPRFYTGTNSRFTGPLAASALGGALSSALTTASSSPSSGRGGGGGGRSSGRGGGGGGGGGW